jgi:hypothetical protein
MSRRERAEGLDEMVPGVNELNIKIDRSAMHNIFPAYTVTEINNNNMTDKTDIDRIDRQLSPV